MTTSTWRICSALGLGLLAMTLGMLCGCSTGGGNGQEVGHAACRGFYAELLCRRSGSIAPTCLGRTESAFADT